MRPKTCLGLLAALLLSGCNQRSATPGEAFATLVVNPLPPDVTRLKAFVTPGRKSPAWFRFDASVQALQEIQSALLLTQERQINSRSNIRFQLLEKTFRNAPQELRPPPELLGPWTMYRGSTKAGIHSAMLVKNDSKTGYAGEVFLCLE